MPFKNIFFICYTFLVFLLSCKSKEKIYYSLYKDNKITLKNNSELNYQSNLASCTSYIINYKYKLEDKKLKIQSNYSDTLKHLENLDVYHSRNINKQIFSYSKDSLICLENGIVFYSEKRMNKKTFKKITYYIFEGEVYKVNDKEDNKEFNAKVKTVFDDNYDILLIDPFIALNKYGITPNYRAICILKKV